MDTSSYYGFCWRLSLCQKSICSDLPNLLRLETTHQSLSHSLLHCFHDDLHDQSQQLQEPLALQEDHDATRTQERTDHLQKESLHLLDTDGQSDHVLQ